MLPGAMWTTIKQTGKTAFFTFSTMNVTGSPTLTLIVTLEWEWRGEAGRAGRGIIYVCLLCWEYKLQHGIVSEVKSKIVLSFEKLKLNLK